MWQLEHPLQNERILIPAKQGMVLCGVVWYVMVRHAYLERHVSDDEFRSLDLVALLSCFRELFGGVLEFDSMPVKNCSLQGLLIIRRPTV